MLVGLCAREREAASRRGVAGDDGEWALGAREGRVYFSGQSERKGGPFGADLETGEQGAVTGVGRRSCAHALCSCGLWVRPMGDA